MEGHGRAAERAQRARAGERARRAHGVVVAVREARAQRDARGGRGRDRLLGTREVGGERLLDHDVQPGRGAAGDQRRVQVVRHREEGRVGAPRVQRRLQLRHGLGAGRGGGHLGQRGRGVVAEDDLGVLRRRDRAGVGQADVAAPDHGEAQRPAGGQRRRHGARDRGAAARAHAAAEPVGPRDRGPVQVRGARLAAGEAAVEADDLAGVDGLAGEVGGGDVSGRDALEVRAGELGERVAALPPRLGRERADVRADQPDPAALELAERRVRGDAARGAEQHDRAAVAGRGHGGRDRGRVAGRLDHDRGADPCGAVRERAGAAAPAPGDDRDLGGRLERGQPPRERADRAGAQHADGEAGERAGAAHPVPGDHGEVGERGLPARRRPRAPARPRPRGR